MAGGLGAKNLNLWRNNTLPISLALNAASRSGVGDFKKEDLDIINSVTNFRQYLLYNQSFTQESFYLRECAPGLYDKFLESYIHHRVDMLKATPPGQPWFSPTVCGGLGIIPSRPISLSGRQLAYSRCCLRLSQLGILDSRPCIRTSRDRDMAPLERTRKYFGKKVGDIYAPQSRFYFGTSPVDASEPIVEQLVRCAYWMGYVPDDDLRPSETSCMESALEKVWQFPAMWQHAMVSEGYSIKFVERSTPEWFSEGLYFSGVHSCRIAEPARPMKRSPVGVRKPDRFILLGG